MKDKILFILIFIIGLLFGTIYFNQSTDQNYAQTDITDFTGGDYFHLVYIGSADCAACNDSLHKEIKVMKDRLREVSKLHDFRLMTTGISVEVNSTRGVEFLNKSGPYDEIIAGAGWYNLGVDNYIWNKFDGEGAIPQVLILKNKFHVNASTIGIMNIERNDSLLYRLSSYKSIKDFNHNMNSKIEQIFD
ncbi:MAG: hypothetical protein HUJ22_01845 [Gracilimonas sp.]|uniref:hypothetical protein n=1 Tax=Gracilimonas sp. TaxID=1974203 RepID=UPI001997C139|nr:hypothetical protein [Gracilimonas sp.]MBD3615286.1 hypothetical protein [Gracilimonas sp.]